MKEGGNFASTRQILRIAVDRDAKKVSVLRGSPSPLPRKAPACSSPKSEESITQGIRRLKSDA